jgi:hypothetical protein
VCAADVQVAEVAAGEVVLQRDAVPVEVGQQLVAFEHRKIVEAGLLWR